MGTGEHSCKAGAVQDALPGVTVSPAKMASLGGKWQLGAVKQLEGHAVRMTELSRMLSASLSQRIILDMKADSD